MIFCASLLNDVVILVNLDIEVTPLENLATSPEPVFTQPTFTQPTFQQQYDVRSQSVSYYQNAELSSI